MRFIACAAASLMFVAAPGAASGAQIDQTICHDIARAAPAGAAYQPGVDAHGRRVVAAQATQPGYVPTPTTVDISVLLPDNILQPSETAVRGEIPVSQFQVHPNGVITFAGQRLGDREQQSVRAICHRFYGVPRE